MAGERLSRILLLDWSCPKQDTRHKTLINLKRTKMAFHSFVAYFLKIVPRSETRVCKALRSKFFAAELTKT